MSCQKSTKPFTVTSGFIDSLLEEYDAGLEGNITNHSLRATGTTELFRAGVPEAIIQQRTGHRSLEALREYEHHDTDQDEAISQILISPSEKSEYSLAKR